MAKIGCDWVGISPPSGCSLATIGLGLIVVRYSLNRLGFFLLVGGLSIAQYVYRIFNTPYHIYAMRRYVPIVIPVLMVYTAVALYLLFRHERRWAQGVALALGVGLMGGLLYQSRYVLPLRDLAGATEQLAQVASALEPEAVIVISEPATSTFADTFGPPLRFIYGHDIVTIRQSGADVDGFIDQLQAVGRGGATAVTAPCHRPYGCHCQRAF